MARVLRRALVGDVPSNGSRVATNLHRGRAVPRFQTRGRPASLPTKVIESLLAWMCRRRRVRAFLLGKQDASTRLYLRVRSLDPGGVVDTDC